MVAGGEKFELVFQLPFQLRARYILGPDNKNPWQDPASLNFRTVSDLRFRMPLRGAPPPLRLFKKLASYSIEIGLT